MIGISPAMESTCVDVKQQHHDEHDEPGSNARIRLDWSFLKNGDLFGRHEEVKALHEAFYRRLSPNTDSSRPELILISGESGTGKTALARTLQQPVVDSRGGYFIVGKFDQLHNRPYGAIVSSFTEFVYAVLVRGPKTVAILREAILEGVGMDTSLLVDMIPALEEILDTRTQIRTCRSRDHDQGHDFSSKKALKVKGTQYQTRMEIAFLNFANSICSVESPLLLVMDDLQWADSGSLHILQLLVSENANKGMVVVGVCRSNEISYSSHFATMLRRLEDEKETMITHIIANRLTCQATSQLVASVLNIPVTSPPSKQLTAVLFAKTGGNPLFVVKLLQALLEEDDIITYKSARGQYDLNESKLIRKFKEVTDVVDLISRRLDHLPEDVKIVLETAACMGTVVDEYLLSKVLVQLNVPKALEIAIEEEIIVYSEKHDRYVFFHDRVQQASYVLIPNDQTELVHLSLGRKLHMSLSDEELLPNIYLVVNQMLRGLRLIEDQAEKNGLAKLCLRAGKLAMLSSDFQTAAMYFWAGIKLLPNKRDWKHQSCHHLSLELYNAAAEAESCNANFEKIDDAVSHVLSNARYSLLDKIRVYSIQIYALWARLRLIEAIDLGLDVLGRLGESFPSKTKITMKDKLAEIIKIKVMLSWKTDEDILRIPDMQDAEKIAAMGILNLLSYYSLVARPEILLFIGAAMVRLSLKYGLSAISAYGFCSFSVICGQLGDLHSAYRFGKLSLSILERYKDAGAAEWVPRVYSCFYGYIASWKQPIRSILGRVLEAETAGLHTGDIEFSMTASRSYCLLAFTAGIKLPKIAAKLVSDLEMMKRYKQKSFIAKTFVQLQMIYNLMGESKNTDILVLTGGDNLGDANVAEVQANINQKDRGIIFQMAMNELILSYHFGNIEIALGFAEKSRMYERQPKAWILVSVLYFYDGLTALAAIAHSSKWEMQQGSRSWCYSKNQKNSRGQLLSIARKNIKKLKKLSRVCPMNCMHKVLIMEAELAAQSLHQQRNHKGKICMKHLKELSMKYDHAIHLAGKEGFVQEQALACELAGLTMENHFAQTSLARPYFEKAMALYNEWGATAKADYVSTRHLKRPTK